ncbi:hypothetical protein HG530_009035 [Fusarium avenaceum]|nr:hypothetical protein HG530_009035 [Fusarium avenaceum]
MDDKLRELSAPLVTVTTMPDQELNKMTELLNGEIGRQTSLSTFFTNNTNTNIGSLDHRDIIATIANTADTLLGVFSNKLGHLRFLERQALAVYKKTSICFASEKIKMLLGVILLLELRNGVDVLATSHKLGADGDTSRSLHLVASQHPNLDASVAKQLQRGLDIFLEFVLYTSHTNKFKIMFQVLLPADDKRTQAFTGHIGSFFVKPVIRCNDGAHDCISTLLKEPYFTTRQTWVLILDIIMKVNDDTHSLALGSEGKHVKNPHADYRPLAVGVFQYHALAITVYKFQANRFCPLNNGNFVRRRRLVTCNLFSILNITSGCDVVAKSESKHYITNTGANFSSCACCAHVRSAGVDTKTDRDNSREQDQESHDFDIPNIVFGVLKTFEGNENDREGQCQGAQDLGQ